MTKPNAEPPSTTSSGIRESAPANEAPAFSAQAFGRYYLLDKIAVGGMAEVFKAKSYSEAGFEKLLVIKRILEHLSANAEFVEMFIDEAKLSVELQHANIVQIYDFGRSGENYFIAMECVEGKDVKNILRKLAQLRKMMPRDIAVQVAIEMCKGLDYAHKKCNVVGEPLNVVHRDISPSNILVSYSGEVKIADFGIAKAESSTYDTKDGVLKGKYEYMSPEQASGNRVDHRSDLFATGIILHEMLTGRRAFKTDSDIKTLEKIKAVDILPPSAINPNIPPSLDRIVMKALARDPEERWADCREFGNALVGFLAPQTPDLLRDGLQRFMAELFADEIMAERQRLAAGSRQAEVLRAEEASKPVARPADWEGNATGTQAPVQAPAPRATRLPLLLAGVALGLMGVITLWFAIRPPETQVIEVERAPVVATTAVLQLVVTPDTALPKVYLGETLISEGKVQVTWSEVPPDVDLRLRVEAEGFTAWEDQIRAAAGEKIRQKVVLQPIGAPPVERPTPEPAPTATAPSPPSSTAAAVRFRSDPAGAEVYVDGVLIGRTPLSWDRASPGGRYSVEIRKAGHSSKTTSVSIPATGGTESVSVSLAAEVGEPGTLRVNVKNGWGDVYIDGKKVDATPLNRSMPAGTYTVRVVNAETGLDQTRKVTLTAGKTQAVTFE